MLKKQILDAIYGKFREKTGYGIVVGVELGVLHQGRRVCGA